MEHGAKRFIRKALFLGMTFYVASLFLSFLFSHAFDWRSRQDPRERILYEPVPDFTGIVLLGDSIWISSFVKSEGDTLWKVLERLTGQHVFNASLNGADSPDFKNVVRLLPIRRGDNVFAFLNVVPTRLLPRFYGERANGNYGGAFKRLLGENFIDRAFVFLQRPLLICNLDILLNCLQKKQYFSVGENRDRVWNKDGDYALKRFRVFERVLSGTDDLRDVAWLRELDGDLGRKGYRLVIVVTPVNGPLIREYASREKAQFYESRISEAHETLVRFLRENSVEYIDCFEDFDSDCFTDLIHPNAQGDRRMAERIARFVASRDSGAGVLQTITDRGGTFIDR